MDPITANPLNNVIILKNINLVIGNNVINHLLGQVQQGWFQVDAQGPAVIYRSAPYNSTTLQLNSSAAVTISLGVY